MRRKEDKYSHFVTVVFEMKDCGDDEDAEATLDEFLIGVEHCQIECFQITGTSVYPSEKRD
jgi:hypothetical protein